MTEDQQKLQRLHNKLVSAEAELKRAMDLLMEIRTKEKAAASEAPLSASQAAEAVSRVVARLPAAWVPDLVVSAGLDGVVTVKVKRWLDKGWREVDAAVGAMGGVWVKQGRESYWRIPSKEGPLT